MQSYHREYNRLEEYMHAARRTFVESMMETALKAQLIQTYRRELPGCINCQYVEEYLRFNKTFVNTIWKQHTKLYYVSIASAASSTMDSLVLHWLVFNMANFI